MNIEEIRKAVPEYENMLPTPYYFKRLVSFYRRLGKNAKKNGDIQNALKYFNQMFSLSKIWHEVYGSKTSGISGGEVDKAENYLKKIKQKHGTYYPYVFQNNSPIEGDVLLSATDYKILTTLVDSTIPEKEKELAQKKNLRKKKVKSSDTKARDSETHFQGIPIRWVDGKKLPSSGRKAKYQSYTGSPLSIEQYVLEHYRSVGYTGIWSENEYWWAIMALLFWDVIFARLPGVYTPEFGAFPSQMQDMPRDFFSKEFFARRKKLIEKRISELTKSRFFGLQQPDIEMELKLAFRKYKGKPCRPINWDKYSTVDSFLIAVKALSSDQLLDVLYRLLKNFNQNRSGLPDLFIAQNDSPIFVEVKSEKEKIADNQINWMKFLKDEVKVEVEICRVVNVKG